MPWSTWPITVTTGARGSQIPAALFLDLLFLDDLLLERDHLHDAVEGLGKIRRGRDVERLVDAGENAAIEQSLQQILGADVEFLGQFADGDAFGNCDRARFTLHRRDRFDHRCGPDPRPHAFAPDAVGAPLRQNAFR